MCEYLTFTDRSTGGALLILAANKPEAIIEEFGDTPHETPGARNERIARQQPELKKPSLGTYFVANGKAYRVAESLADVKDAFGIEDTTQEETY